MPSRVLETVLTGRNLLSPVLTGAAADVEAYDAKVTAASGRAAESARVSATAQESAAAKVTAANTRAATSSTESSAKVVAANARSAESMRAFADVSESSAARSGIAFGSLATKALPLAAAAVAVVSGKMAADFQANVVRLETTAGEAHKNLAMISQGLLDMAPAVGISANTLAQGMYTVESAGFHGADALKVEKAAAQGAAQEHADLAKVTDAVTTALHDYHLPASQAADVTSKMVEAVSHGKTTFDELTGSLHSVTPLASVLGVSLADVTGTLSAMTASGMSADQATQNMADTLRHLVNPTSTMTSELAQLGITSSDLSNDLSTKGLAGTLQMVETAIVNHMDPATQKVLLPALNQSKIAAQDMTAMIAAMPPALAKASQSLLDGTTTIKDYRTAAKDMGGQQGAMALQFLALMQSADGFNQVLKAGGPQAQAVAAAMAKSFGTSSALNVALMTTGQNAAATNTAISDINKAAADGKGDIKGWAEVQGTAAQQAKEAAAGVGKLAIELGDHLLPAATGALGYINRDVIPGLEHLGSGVGDAVAWFKSLPGPVKEAVLALAALKIVTGTDMFAGLLASGRVVAVGFAHDMGTMVTSARAGAGQITAAFAEAKAAQQALVAEQFGASAVSRATGDLRGLGAAAGTAAKGGLSAMKSAAGGLVGMLGGPWMVATAGAVVGVVALMDAIKRHDAEIKQATADVQKWNETISLGGSGQSAIQAQSRLEDLRQKLAGVTAEIDRYNAAAQGGYARGGIGTLVSQQAELRGELDKGSAAWKAQLAAMTPVQEATARVQIAEHDLQMVRKTNPDNSQAVTNAEIRLQTARESLTGETDRANASEKTRIQRLQDSADAVLGLVDANRQAQEASLELTQQVSDYNSQIADGTLKGDALKSATLGIVDGAERAAKAAGDAAAQQAKQNGATDTASASQAGFMKSLQDAASTMSGPARKALEDYIAQLGGQQTQAQLTAGAINGLGVQVTDLPNSHMITIDVPTDAQMQKLHDLGYVTTTLPDGHIVVTADTNPAIGEIQDLLNYARQQSITYRSNLPDLVPGVSGGGRMGHYAGGGWTGPGSKFTPAGVVHADEFVFTKEQTAKAGGPAGMYALASALDRGFANGGWVNMPTGGWYAGGANIPLSVDETQAKGVIAQMYKASAAQAAALAASAGGAARWAPLVDQVLRMLGLPLSAEGGILNMINHESGGNPNAINLTDSNARAGHPSQGLMQTIPSTFYAYAGPFANLGITSPIASIYAGVNYAEHVYGLGMLTSGGRRSASGGYMGYETGTDWVPRTGLALIHEGEAVIPKSINMAARSAAYNAAGTGFTAAAMPGYSRLPAGGGGATTFAPHVTVQARVFLGDREITDIVRVEATAVVDRELGAITDTIHYAGG